MVEEVAPVAATSLRVLANAVEGDPGWVARHEGPLLDAAAPHCQSAHKNVRVALATLYVNAAVRLGRGGDPDAKARVVAGALEVLKAVIQLLAAMPQEARAFLQLIDWPSIELMMNGCNVCSLWASSCYH